MTYYMWGKYQGQQIDPLPKAVIDHEAPPTHFHKHFKQHDIYYWGTSNLQFHMKL